MRVLARPGYRRLLLWWLGTRVLLMLWATTALPWFSHGSVLGDVTIYRGWAHVLAGGTYPVHDPQWQYPPAAALIFLVPQALTHLGLSYIIAFFLFALAADLAVFALLLGHADRNAAADGAAPHLTGVWVWVVGGFAMGPLLLMRYDVIVTALAVGGLVAPAAAVSTRWSVRGALIGLGTMVKAWPGILVLGLPPKGPGRRALAWAVGTALAVTGILSLSLTGAFSFLTGQSDRGIEVESVLASPFMVAALVRLPGQGRARLRLLPDLRARRLRDRLLRRTAHRRRHRDHPVVAADALPAALLDPALMYDTAFTAVLVLVVTSRVLSPQYLIWLLGLSAVVLTENGPMRRATVLARPGLAGRVLRAGHPVRVPAVVRRGDGRPVLGHLAGGPAQPGPGVRVRAGGTRALAGRRARTAGARDGPSRPAHRPGGAGSGDACPLIWHYHHPRAPAGLGPSGRGGAPHTTTRTRAQAAQ